MCPSQVTGDVIVYSNELIYMPLDHSKVMPFSHPVVCTYPRWVFTPLKNLESNDGGLKLPSSVSLRRPKDWFPRIYDPVFDTFGQSDLVFHMEIMNGR